jgi:(E)-4-hydroxy-3-methylbut-2-enyl-diphosphate synthase
VAVIGCVVNGPGEAKAADIGLAGGSPCLVYLEGKPSYKVSEEQIVDELEKQVRARIAQRKLAPQEANKIIPIKVAG